MISYERAHELFLCDPETGTVTRRVRRGNQAAGCRVGCPDERGYEYIGADGCQMLLHRLIFLMHYGWLPENLDHVNRDKSDSRILNLRPATPRQNIGNSSPPRDNTSGFKGVCRHARSGMWHAQLTVSGKPVYLGSFKAPEDAAHAYDEAAKKHFGEFAWLNYAEK